MLLHRLDRANLSHWRYVGIPRSHKANSNLGNIQWKTTLLWTQITIKKYTMLLRIYHHMKPLHFNFNALSVSPWLILKLKVVNTDCCERICFGPQKHQTPRKASQVYNEMRMSSIPVFENDRSHWGTLYPITSRWKGMFCVRVHTYKFMHCNQTHDYSSPNIS